MIELPSIPSSDDIWREVTELGKISKKLWSVAIREVVYKAVDYGMPKHELPDEPPPKFRIPEVQISEEEIKQNLDAGRD